MMIKQGLGSIRRFARCTNGASAIEFAMVVPFFFGLAFSIIEAGVYFFTASSVEAASAKAARLIRTGQVADKGTTGEEFFTEICNVVRHFGKCEDKLTVEVQRFTSFQALAAASQGPNSEPTCRDADPAAVNSLAFQPGAQRDIVRVRVCYLHSSINPGLGVNLQRAANGDVRMIATTIFRNEPF